MVPTEVPVVILEIPIPIWLRSPVKAVEIESQSPTDDGGTDVLSVERMLLDSAMPLSVGDVAKTTSPEPVTPFERSDAARV